MELSHIGKHGIGGEGRPRAEGSPSRLKVRGEEYWGKSCPDVGEGVWEQVVFGNFDRQSWGRGG